MLQNVLRSIFLNLFELTLISDQVLEYTHCVGGSDGGWI